ncbi:MAG: Gfo/Idh/MocA family oxidoreductase [Thermoguttaceae bacterium]|jgi:predicted dehydrogenase
MKLRVGLVGLGDVWHQRHAPALHMLSDRFEVRAVCDQVAHRAQQAAIEFGAAPVDGFRALAHREDIDAILLLAPQWYGALPILAACDSGRAVYCAAGMDLDLAEAQLVKRRVEEAGVAFMAEFPRRQAPATLRLKELIATRLGAPRLLFCHQRSVSDQPGNSSRTRWPRQSGVRHLVELVDWCRYLVDREATFVTGIMHPSTRPKGEEDYQMMSLDFSDAGAPGSGTVAQISCGRYIPAPWQEAITYRPLAGLQVSCESGIAFVDIPSTLVWFDEAGRHQESLERERPVAEQLLTQFFRSVTSLVRKTSDLEDAYRALLIVQEARRSQGEGRRIALE